MAQSNSEIAVVILDEFISPATAASRRQVPQL